MDRNNVVRFKERKRDVNSRDEREPVDRNSFKRKKIFYNEEFDPGSG